MSLSHPLFQTSVAPATAAVLTNAENKVQSKPNIVFEVKKERIKKMFNKVNLSVSTYNTAWVVMIPSPSSPEAPLFPRSLNWLLENQQNDGSWSLPHRHELLTKDSLLSTLACVLALKRWGVGEQQTNKEQWRNAAILSTDAGDKRWIEKEEAGGVHDAEEEEKQRRESRKLSPSPRSDL
ncbi:ent-kaurene synthase 5, chloroplastic-like [Prosopis cineraria]|uniref:ent-kaurene synthase 5, chloroplastic-like n=1 Tax=Prosopis cineraria TaxID=364024 RepID=UPI0024101A17|nr:ent-kaurene synthase 5, chloroplastic-like [Prosopis cineraria]